MKKYDVIIIGTGISALTTARFISELTDKKILLLEQHYVAGGNLHAFRRKGKYIFNAGVHYLGHESIFRPLYNFLTHGVLQWNKLPDRYDHFIFPDFDIYREENINNFQENIKQRFPKEKDNIDRLFKDCQKAGLTVFLLPTILKSLPGGLTIFRFLKNVFSNMFAMSAKDYLDKHIKDERLKALMMAHWGDIGAEPDAIPYFMMTGLDAHFSKGAYHPEGSGENIAKTTIDVLQNDGHTILTNHSVKEIIIKRSTAKGVEVLNKVTGESVKYYANTIISSAGMANTFNKLVNDERISKIYQREIASFSNGFAAYHICYGLNETKKEWGFNGENKWIFASHKHEEIQQMLPGEAMMFVSMPSMKNHWVRGSTVEIVIPMFAQHKQEFFEKWGHYDESIKSEEYEVLKNEIDKRVRGFLDERFPGFADQICLADVATPLTFEHYLNAYDGQFYGLNFTTNRMHSELNRPKTKVKNLFLTGQDITSPGVGSSAFAGIVTVANVVGLFKTIGLLKKIISNKYSIVDQYHYDQYCPKWKGALKVSNIIRESSDSLTFRLENTEKKKYLPFKFKAGQYLRLSFYIDGKNIFRNYSIASSAANRSFCDLTVKQEEYGKGSSFLCEQVDIGDVIVAEGPIGEFVLQDEQTNSALFIAGGVGLTPLMSMIRTLRDTGKETKVVLIYSTKKVEDILYEKELAMLSQLPWCTVRITLTRQTRDNPYGNGRINKELIAQHLDEKQSVYICGPEKMMNTCLEATKDLGVDESQIHTESFGGKSLSILDGEVVTLTYEGVDYKGTENQTLLEILQENDVDFPFECMAGGCESCKGKIENGKYKALEDTVLSKNERDEGFVLTCNTYPRSDIVLTKEG